MPHYPNFIITILVLKNITLLYKTQIKKYFFYKIPALNIKRNLKMTLRHKNINLRKKYEKIQIF